MSGRYEEVLEAGTDAFAAGHLSEARRAFETAASIRLGDPVPRSYLAEACLRSGDKAAARDALEQVMLLRPGEFQVVSALAKLEIELGNSARGAELTGKASQLVRRRVQDRLRLLAALPGDLAKALAARRSGKGPGPRAGIDVLRGQRAIDEHRLAAAEAHMLRAMAREPEHPEVLRLCSRLLHAIGQSEAGHEWMLKAAALRPDDPDFQVRRVQSLASLDGAAALAEWQALPDALRTSRRGRWAQAIILQAIGRDAEARDIFAELHALEPNVLDGALGLAWTEMSLGHFEPTREALRRAAEICPRAGIIYWLAVLSRTIEKDDPLYKAAVALTEDPEAGLQDRARAEKAVGRVLISARENAAGFEHLRRGNAMVEMTYDPVEQEERIEAIIEAFPRELFEDRPESDRGEGRIFIVGLPRCGSTLVEQILDSHPMVHGAGEPNGFYPLTRQLEANGSYPGGIGLLDEDELDAIAEAYLARVPTGPGGQPFVADKDLWNFHALGLIALLFPKARIVNCRRNIMDNGFSLFSHIFPSTYPFATNLRNIGHFYGLYRRLMAHWHEVLPIPVHELWYEHLVEDTEGKTRDLLDAVGLPFDDACLRFHENVRSVKTSSLQQVRQQVYSSSIGSWRRFEEGMAPLREMLGDIDEPPPL